MVCVLFFLMFLASPVSGKSAPAASVTGSPKPLNSGLVPKQERTSGTGGILNLNLGQCRLQKYILYICVYVYVYIGGTFFIYFLHLKIMFSDSDTNRIRSKICFIFKTPPSLNHVNILGLHKYINRME